MYRSLKQLHIQPSIRTKRHFEGKFLKKFLMSNLQNFVALKDSDDIVQVSYKTVSYNKKTCSIKFVKRL